MSIRTAWGAQRVVWRAARVLDERTSDWWERVNLNTLNTLDPAWCVLGQVYGHYHTTEAYEVREITDYRAFWPVTERATRLLDAAWKRAIRRRGRRQLVRYALFDAPANVDATRDA